MSRYVRTFLFSALLLSLTTIAVFQTGHTKADTSEFWISVDSTELQYIVANRGSKDAADLGKLKVSKVLNNIAIVPLNDLQMEELSRSMHDNFHKCSGYVAHTSEADAIEWVRNMESARTDTALVNYTINNPITVDALLAETSEPYIRQVILDLSAFPNRRYNQSSGLQSANWIKDKWSSLVATQNRGLFSVDFFNHPT
jgi:bacterial leucyl aminopeptidase